MGQELEYYKEQTAHGRHIEVQRSTITGVALTVSGAIVGELIKRPRLTRADLTYTVALFSIGLVALLLTAKLYERFRLHNAIAKKARDLMDVNLGKLRREAEAIHRKGFPFLSWLPLHLVWNGLFAALSLAGLLASVIAWHNGWGDGVKR